ncbi:MAG: hypothetical protein JRJ26_16130, partial [Deltaproteobacteria bacterium]|nr:hypothetical protein [Deltaproteobacteria bacterium]
MSRRLIAFMNAYTEGISGGDACFVEIAKRLVKYDKIVITSILGKRLCESRGLKARYLITTKEHHFENVIYTYSRRLLKALFLRVDVSEGDILYATSDFIPDVIPALIKKICKRKTTWVQKIFHLIPSDRIVP